MRNLKIYYIHEKYINYLRQFDKNVAYNKNTTRPYIGIVYTYNNHNYFAPLASPKKKHININPKAIDIYKIKNGELGVVNINNMIPTPIEELTEVLPTVKDAKYKKMLEEQLTFLNNHKAELFKKIKHFQNMFRKGTQEDIEKYFPIAKASTLSLEDELLKHEPETNQQTRFKNALISAIKSGLSDFRAQRMDACFDEEGNICFKAGMKPAVGKSPNWWKETAKKFMPEKGSRLGTTKERIAFLGLLIRYLIEEKGYTVSNAWKAVCDQSKDLGHYWDSENAKHDFEDTGSRQVGEWYDLANTYKITVDDEAGGFSLVGGNYNDNGNNVPLAYVFSVFNPNNEFLNSVGWLVLSV